MARPQIHPNWDRKPEGITEGFSLEITAKDVAALREAAPLIPAESPIAITFLPGDAAADRIAAAVAVRELGYEPMPHFSARRIVSREEFESYLEAVVAEAGVRRCFIVAGDPPEPQGPYFDTSALIATGAFEGNGITAIGIGGHPEGHPNMTPEEAWAILEAKVTEIERRGMAPLVVTQFGFDPDAFLNWLAQLRARYRNAGPYWDTGASRYKDIVAVCGALRCWCVGQRYGQIWPVDRQLAGFGRPRQTRRHIRRTPW